MQIVFKAGFCSSGMVYLAREGTQLGETAIPRGHVGIATICSVAVNGCLLKSGIPVYARFGGLIQIKSGQPFRFVDLIEFSGSTIDPSDIFIAGKMTGVMNASLNGEGKVLASYHEIPMLSVSKADELLQRLKNSNIINSAILARPGDKICEIPFNHEKVGLITLSGLNPAAAAVEAGIQIAHRAMCGMIEVSKMRPIADLL